MICYCGSKDVQRIGRIDRGQDLFFLVYGCQTCGKKFETYRGAKMWELYKDTEYKPATAEEIAKQPLKDLDGSEFNALIRLSHNLLHGDDA
jgi:hypothetical protein